MNTKSTVQSKIQLLLKMGIFIFGVAIMLSCESEGDNPTNADLQEIEQFLTPETVQALENIGFNINPGDNPPTIEGTYYAEHILLSTTVPDDPQSPGDTFLDVTTTFSNQTGSSIFIERFEEGTNTIGEGTGALITGEASVGGTSKFSVFAKLDQVDGSGHNYTVLTAISGDMLLDSSGNPIRILEYQSAGFMLDNNGNPNENLLPNNTGRLLGDENNSADRID
ncbi:hypothetical protein [Flavobacteriaceae bacterium 14752]|uniref:hypothetical protein n=1 Tax=Mesohalobacter salilacus TaxID=2491711 RepID=UPI000F6416F2|nr:hypothetical protein EIG84_01850 [Flavobacteriaceae bacterium 14752]